MSSLYYDKIKFAVTALWKSYRFSGSVSIIFKLHFDSKTSILVLSEKQNAVKMGINEKRDVRFVKNVVSRVI